MFPIEFSKYFGAKPLEKPDEPPLMEPHFVKVAFLVSSLVLFFLAPLSFLLSAASGFALHYAIEPNLKTEPPVIGPVDAVIAIVGGAAQLLKATPAGKTGNFIFQSIPFICTMSIGSTAYKVFSARI